MASRNIKLAAFAAVTALGGAGYYLYSATAQSAAPQLAQAPLNVSRSIPPAFIMAVDNSGSMAFEMLFPGTDGQPYWDTTTGGQSSQRCANGTRVNCFFDTSGNIRTSTGEPKYVFLFPQDVRSDSVGANGHKGIPPIGTYGFARSHQYNPAYFNPYPEVEYLPWKTSAGADYPLPNPANMAFDPRNSVDRINLSEVRYDRADDGDTVPSGNEKFHMPAGGVLPAGTMYYRESSGCTQISGSGTGWRTLPANHRFTQNCDIGIAFFPATFYLRTDAPAPAGYKTAVVTPDSEGRTIGGRSLAENACGDGCNLYRYEIRPENYDSGYGQALQKFANWLHFYGNRDRAVIAGMTNALSDVSRMRVGHFKIHSPPVAGDTSFPIYNMANDAQRASLYQDIIRRSCTGDSAGNPCASGGLFSGTPNHRAVDRMGAQFMRTDANAPIQRACQKNAGMLFTDGYANRAYSFANHDAAGTTPPPPFPDNSGSKMSDIAYYYYKTPLRTGTGWLNQVPVPKACEGASPDPRLDCNRNPHMNFYGVTLGTPGNIYQGPNDPLPWNIAGDTVTPRTLPWPASDQGGDRNTIDGLWQATLNTRGDFINATTPTEITEAMRKILASVGDGNSPAGSIALSGARVPANGSGSLTVMPSYTADAEGNAPPTDWYGELEASVASSNPLTGAITMTSLWRASERLPAHGSRNIRFGVTGASVVPSVYEFNSSGISAAGLTLQSLCSNDLAPVLCATNIGGLGVNINQAVNYLRGDQTLENATSGPRLRSRTKVLGDIINSVPVVTAGRIISQNPVVRTVDDYRYQSLGGALAESYAGYLETKRRTGKQMVYVGANDGMLHAFDGDTGVETFAYIPATAVGHLGNLLFPYDPMLGAQQRFQHRYYVDGRITISDAYIDGQWKTVLVGASGAGGRSVFALDVTNPSNITVMWEVNDLVSGNATVSENIGYVLGKPSVVPVKEGSEVKWKAIFGNGYGSAGGGAALFVVDVETGATSVIEAAESTAGNDVPSYNGLGSVAVLDRLRAGQSGWGSGMDGMVDTVYAADLNGAIWKFDLTSNSVALGGMPLYVARDSAGNRQRITGGLEVAAGPGTAMMVYFGTGSFWFEGDETDTSVQSFYAVIDRGAPVNGRGNLLRQAVGTDSADGFRATSANVITSAHLGWYIDMPAGERMVGTPQIASGIVFFTSYEPPSAAGDACGLSGTNRLYGLSARNGAASLTQVRVMTPDGDSPGSAAGGMVLNTGGTAPVTDVALMATPRVQPLSAGATAQDLEKALDARCMAVIGVPTNDGLKLYTPRPCGRQSWRQVR